MGSDTPSPCLVFALGCRAALCPVPWAGRGAGCCPCCSQQSQTALPGLGAPWAWTSEARASLLSSLEEMGGCWVGFYGVCMDSQALHCCLPVASWERLAFPTRLVGKSSITALVGRLHGVGDVLGSGTDQAGWISDQTGGTEWHQEKVWEPAESWWGSIQHRDDAHGPRDPGALPCPGTGHSVPARSPTRALELGCGCGLCQFTVSQVLGRAGSSIQWCQALSTLAWCGAGNVGDAAEPSPALVRATLRSCRAWLPRSQSLW